MILHSRQILALYRQLATCDLTIVDVETTGSKPDSHWVIEISVLQGCPQAGIKEHKTQLIQPPIPIPPDIQRFTGITPDLVATAPFPAQAWPPFLPLLNTGVFTAHNLPFDYGFIQAEFQRLGVQFSRPTTAQFCTLKLARLVLAHLPSRRLPDLVRHFRFGVTTSHRAEADTLACWYLTLELIKILDQTSDQKILQQLGEEWLTLGETAHLLNCDPTIAATELESSVINKRTRRGELLYQRHSVEQLCPWPGV